MSKYGYGAYREEVYWYCRNPCVTPCGLWIREQRLQRNLTCQQLADLIGCTERIANQYESRVTHPCHAHRIEQLAETFDTDTSEVWRIIQNSRHFMRYATAEQYKKFIDDQQVGKMQRRYLDAVRPKRYERKIYGNPHSGFNTYSGVTNEIRAAIPHPVGLYMDELANQKRCSVADIMRMALEVYALVEMWPIKWDSEPKPVKKSTSKQLTPQQRRQQKYERELLELERLASLPEIDYQKLIEEN